jgi:hypothetical protein
MRGWRVSPPYFIVPMRHARFCALILLACWQILLASADDFNLARFLFSPSETNSKDLLPLDDPNCDFTQLSETRTPENSPLGGDGNLPAIALRSDAKNRTPASDSPEPGHFSRICSNTPLRC